MLIDPEKKSMLRMDVGEAAPFPLHTYLGLKKLRDNIHAIETVWSEKYAGRRYHIFREVDTCWVVRTK